MGRVYMPSRIRELREARGWSRGELARRMREAGLGGLHKLDRRLVWAWERTGKGSRRPNGDHVTALCEVFGTPPGTFYG